MNYWKYSTELKEKAKTHTKEMDNRYKNETEKSFNQSIIYGVNAKETKNIPSINNPNITIIQTDVVSSLFELPKDKKIAVLNFASYKNPGGGFLQGSRAQEECLCQESNLYNILIKFDEYYKWNNEHKNKGLYLDRAIYTPNVIFERDNNKQIVDVLTCAAPNFGVANNYQNVTSLENYKVLRQRALFIKQILEENNVEIAILGAWGTGVFKQDVEEVAKLWKYIFETSTITEIVHPIIDISTFYKFNKVYKN